MPTLRSITNRIPILMYHQISAAPPRYQNDQPTPYRSIYVSPKKFSQQMRWLKFLGWQGLSMPALMPYLRGEVHGKVFGITFDDGYHNNLQHALPVLMDCRFSATCYVVAGQIDRSDARGNNFWDREKGVRPSPLMNLSDCQEWLKSGMDIGSHTLTHADLPTLSKAESMHEIAAAKQHLENLLQVETAHFCYPYGRLEVLHKEQVQAAGYVSATTTEIHHACAPLEAAAMFDLPRLGVWRAARLPGFLWKVLRPR